MISKSSQYMEFACHLSPRSPYLFSGALAVTTQPLDFPQVSSRSMMSPSIFYRTFKEFPARLSNDDAGTMVFPGVTRGMMEPVVDAESFNAVDLGCGIYNRHEVPAPLGRTF